MLRVLVNTLYRGIASSMYEHSWASGRGERSAIENHEAVRQTTIRLPHFDYEVPVVSGEDGASYIPLIALCEMLGLRVEDHLPRWRRLMLWRHTKKLVCTLSHGRRRRIWCLHLGAMVFWFSCFDWSLVLPERREQLRQATEEGIRALAQVQQTMLTQYTTFRRRLFEFLTAYAQIETTLPQFSASLHVYLNDFAVCIAWEGLISQGKTLIGEAATYARNLLQDQATIPLVDVVSLNAVGEVIAERSLPLLPVVSEEESARFITYLDKIVQWHQQVRDFLKPHGVLWDEKQKKWYLV